MKKRDEVLERLAPYSIEAEMAILSSALKDKDCIPTVLHMIDEDDFYSEANKQIFRAIKSIYLRNIPPEIVTTVEELRRNDLLENIGGLEYITTLFEFASTSANVEHYARIVKQKSILRKLMKASSKIIEDISRGDDEPEKIIDRAQQSIFSISYGDDLSGLLAASKLVEPTLEKIEKLITAKRLKPEIPTGYKRLDEILAGFHPGNFVIIAGRPGMGKTSFSLNILANLTLRENLPVALFSLEMSKEEVMLRLLCSEAEINSHLLKRGLLPAKKSWSKITEAAIAIKNSSIYIDDTSDLSIIDLKLRSRKLSTELKSRNKKLAMIIVDYLQLLRPVGRYDTRQQEIAEISRMLKSLAKELNISVVAVSQLSRKPEGRESERRRPQLADLRESGALEQDADVVIFIYREGVYKPYDPELRKKSEIIIAKQRHGPIGKVDFTFFEDWTRFEEVEK